MFEDKIIRDFSNHQYSYQEFLEEIKDYNIQKYDFFIGSDSQVVKDKINLVTCLCPRKQGDIINRSGKVFYIKDKINRKDYPNLRTRMLLEAYRSIELAMALDPYITTKISIHLDIGETYRSKTSSYQKELKYLVTAQGYECEIKPNSWAAAAVADKVSRS